MVLCNICNKELLLKDASFSYQKFIYDSDKKLYKLSNPFLHHVVCSEKMQIVLKENRVYKDLDTQLRFLSKEELAKDFQELEFIKWDNFSEHPVTIVEVIKNAYELIDLSVFYLFIDYEDGSKKDLLCSIDWSRNDKSSLEDVLKYMLTRLPKEMQENMVAYKFIRFGTDEVVYQWVDNNET